MSYWHECIIDGVDFEFSDGRILLKPEVDITNPEFIRAYRKAQVLCPVIDAAQMITSMGGSLNNWHWLDDGELESLIEAIGLVENQIDIQVSALHTPFMEAAKKEYQHRQAKKRQAEERTSGKQGFVYLLKSPSGFYKIGRTKSPEDRLRTFSVKLPFEVEFEHITECQDMYYLEKTLHKRFADNRVNGEWFDLTADDVAYIKSIGGEA